MKTSTWNVRFNAPKPERDPEIPALDAEVHEGAATQEGTLDGAVPDSDPNRPLR